MAYIKLQIPRLRFTRYGLTDGRDWKTATGVRITYKGVAGITGVVKFDDLIIKAGADGRILSGIYKLRQRYVYDDDSFIDYSPAGPPTSEIFLDGQAIQANMTTDAVAAMDPQVTKVWNYLFSDKLGAYFKVRDYLDLTRSKFSLNEFDWISHANVNADDMTRHCTFGLVLGDRFDGTIVTDSSTQTTTTLVPESVTRSLTFSSTTLDYVSSNLYGTNNGGSGYMYYATITVPTNDGINSATVRAQVYVLGNGGEVHAYLFVLIGGVYYYSADVLPLSYGVFHEVSKVWSTSPATGVAWTDAELAAAQFGVYLNCPGYEVVYTYAYANLDISYNVSTTVTVEISSAYNPYSMIINTSDTDMLLDNLPLDTSENVPPSNVIRIIGPHYGRMLCLTTTHIYPSQPNSPSLFKYAYAFRVGDAKTETALWAVIMGGSLYVGTTVDIYRFDGDLQQLPNDTLNLQRMSLGIGNPPVDRSVAINDDMLVYHAADGYRVLVGNSSTSINSNLDLLTRGYTRNNVPGSKQSIGVQSAAFGLRGLYTTFPVTDNTDIRLNEFVEPGTFEYSNFMGFVNLTAGFSTPPSYTRRVTAFDIRSKEWEYYTYPVDITCLYRTTNGRLVAGTRDGKVVQMEYGTGDMDSTTAVEVRTPYMDSGLPVTYKEMFELAVIADTNNETLTYKVHDDVSSAAVVSDTVALNGRTVLRRNMEGLRARRFQLRLSGDFTALRLYDFNMSMRPVPQHRTYLDTGNIRVGAEEFHWYRQIRLMAIAMADFIVDIYFDDTLLYSESLTATVGTAKIYTVDLQEDASGRQPRLVIRTGTAAAEATTDVGFEVYWVEWIARTSGRKNKQPRVRWDNSTNDNVPPE